MMNIKRILQQGGFLMISTLVFAGIAVLLISTAVGGAHSVLKYSQSVHEREVAFQIAEAGVEYYRWHLAHHKTDYQDGTGAAGPYHHIFYDKAGTRIGTFSLTITPPPSGSTIVTVLSEGRVDSNPSVVRAVRVRLAVPSLAKYAVAANDVMRFGEGTEVFGPIHSNKGIRFDGLAHNIVTSALTTYDDPDHTGSNEYAVHTHLKIPITDGLYPGSVIAESPPAALAVRTDVFQAGRQISVPAIDFAGITTDLATMKTEAQASGRYLAPSSEFGYEIVLKTNDTYDLYRVKNLVSTPNWCNNSSWSIRNNNGRTSLGNFPFPANGIIFVEDHVWVRGQIATARLTIASGKFPDQVSQRTNIIVNSDLLYSNYNGQDVIALVAQNDVLAGMVSADTLRIDAALIAQNGKVGRLHYNNFCSPYDDRSELTLYGMIGTNVRYGFAFTDGSGYAIRNIIYDGHLLYGPPPLFPLTSDQYQVISWEEVL